MENLKLGDVKKFILEGKEVIGVIVGKYSNTIDIVTLSGDEKRIEYISQKQKNNQFRYTAVRLDPKLRKQFEIIGEEAKKYWKIREDIKKMEKEIKKLDDESRVQWGKVCREKDKIADVQGKITPDNLYTIFKRKVEKEKPYFYKKLFSLPGGMLDTKGINYRVSVKSDEGMGGQWLCFLRVAPIYRYQYPGPYDFVESCRVVTTETKQYKKLVKDFHWNDTDFTVNPLKGKIEKGRGIEEYDGRDADSYSLVYYHYVNIFIPYDCLTENYIDKLVDSMKCS